MPERFARSSRLWSDYGMLFVLLLLCGAFGVVTYSEQYPTGEAAARQLAADILQRFGHDARVLVAAQDHREDVAFANKLQSDLTAAGAAVQEVVKGEAKDARQALGRLSDSGARLDVIACNQTTASWLVFAHLESDFPALRGARVVTPRSYWWPTFLKPDNLRNVANQIAVIAIVAVGMTMVIITGGIDLSVGSLIALSAVLSALTIREFAGGLNATPLGMTLACLVGITACGLVGLFSGIMVTGFRIPPFIVTLAMMWIASGSVYRLTKGESVYQIPESFVWLGMGADLLGIPNSVVLMLLLYGLAHLMMSRMALGRYLYAVGGNRQAAHLSGVPVQRVLLFAYTASGLLAGLGGIVLASRLKSGSPTYGKMYELYTIAAAVVGGTSLSGGEGKMTGTLIGVFIIAVIQNGMNLTNIDPYTQQIVLGSVLLGAVLLDRLTRWSWTSSHARMD